ncbi:hypothetical protein XfCFBP8078_05255, partial [Xylella fastidiosa subsp. multiplex]
MRHIERILPNGITVQNIPLIKATKLPEKAQLQRHAGGAASMAPRPARIKMPYEAGMRLSEIAATA